MQAATGVAKATAATTLAATLVGATAAGTRVETLAGAGTPVAKVAVTAIAEMQAPVATREEETAAGAVAETPAEGTLGVVEGTQAGALGVGAEVEVREATAAGTRVEAAMLEEATEVGAPAQVAALVRAAASPVGAVLRGELAAAQPGASAEASLTLPPAARHLHRLSRR